MEAEFNKEKVLARVRKMMALANDAAATEGERDNAIRMAHATLAKYNLSMAEADKAGVPTEEARVNDAVVGKDFPWMRTTTQAIAKLFFCEHFFVRMSGGKVKHYFVGKESNVFTAKSMSEYIISSIDREARARSLLVTGSSNGNYWRSFCKGAADVIWTRCMEIRSKAEAAPKVPGTSLVLASVYAIENKANEDYIARQMGLKLKMGNTRQRNTSADAHAAGVDFGSKVSLNTQIGSNNANAKRIR